MTVPLDLHRARAETPGCTRVLHFNNAGCSLPPAAVVEAVQSHLSLEAQIGGYEAAEASAAAISRPYDAVATLLSCGRDEIALVENATRAWDMAFYSLRFSPGDRILTGQAEYASNVIAFLQVAKRSGARIEVVPDDSHGQLDTAALERLIDDRVKLIALTHVPTNGGLVNPAEAVGVIARKTGVPFLLDACQSAGQMPLNVDHLGCDMLSATGRKFLRAPRGTGFLYVRRSWIERLDPPFLDLRAATWNTSQSYEIRRDARRFENWESFVAGRIGLGVAVDYALEWGLESIEERVTALAELLRARLGELPGVRVHDKGIRRCGIVTFTKDDRDPAQLVRSLRQQSINASVSVEESTRFDMEARRMACLLRASVHYYNTEEEVERFCAAVAAC
jgi:cysteine desulfurase / selenocysteine lyase